MQTTFTRDQADAQVMRHTAAAQRRTMAEALEAIRFHECTLLRRPEGGWWVAPDTGPDNAFTISNTRFAADLDDAVSAADQIDRRRTGRW
jgi:hypothetical protein